MAKLITTAPRGTQDVLPEESYKWQYIEQALTALSQKFGFHEVRTLSLIHISRRRPRETWC